MCNHLTAKSIKQLNCFHRRRQRFVAHYRIVHGKYSDADAAFDDKERERARRLKKYISHIEAKKEAARCTGKFSKSVDPR